MEQGNLFSDILDISLEIERSKGRINSIKKWFYKRKFNKTLESIKSIKVTKNLLQSFIEFYIDNTVVYTSDHIIEPKISFHEHDQSYSFFIGFCFSSHKIIIKSIGQGIHCIVYKETTNGKKSNDSVIASFINTTDTIETEDQSDQMIIDMIPKIMYDYMKEILDCYQKDLYIIKD